MSAIALLAIVVAAGEAQSPVTTALLSAASEASGPGAVVRIFEVKRPTDPEALRIEREQTARAVVELSWLDTSHLHAVLRIHATVTNRWVDREIDFDATDPIAERGRALGFAVASMLPEADPTLPVATAPTLSHPQESIPSAPLGRHALEVAAAAGTGLGGAAAGYGGTLAVELFLSDAWSAHLEAGVRLGHLPDLDAQEFVSSFGAGATWWVVASTPARPFGVGLRGEALVLYQLVSHHRTSGQLEWKGAPLPGASARLEGGWRVVGPLELVARGGIEAAFGTVTVDVVPAPAGAGPNTIPVFRAVGEAGIRLRF
jgi:hypothetical protein